MITHDDVTRLRADCPGLPGLAYFNNAGVGLPSCSVMTAIADYLAQEATLGPKQAETAAAAQIAATRAAAARLIGADPDEIFFTGSATEAWGRAAASLPPFKPGDRILVGRHEWGGNLATLERMAERTGADIAIIGCAEDGTVSPKAMAAQIDDRVRLIALTWCPANGGLINPAAAIGAVARAADIPFFIDASQALGQIPIDVVSLGCDVLAAPGRKFLRGPRGTGLLYIRKGFLDRLDPPWRDVHAGPDGRALAPGLGLESGEQSIALLMGLKVALDRAHDLGIGQIRAHLDSLATEIRSRLATIDGVTLRDLGTERSALVSFTLDHGHHQAALAHLAHDQIVIGGNGVAYTPHDMAARGLDTILRVSPHCYTDDQDIDRLIASLKRYLVLSTAS